MSKKTTTPTTTPTPTTFTAESVLTVRDLLTFERNPLQPEARKGLDAYPMALDLAERGQDNPILWTIWDGVPTIAQGHRRRDGFELGVDIGIMSLDCVISHRYKDYADLAEMSKDVGDHGTSLGLQNKWELYQILAPQLRSKLVTYDKLALIHAESFRALWNVEDSKEAAIRAKVRMAQMCQRNGDKEAAEVCLKEAGEIAGEYRRGAIQTYAYTAKGPACYAEYMKRQWLGQLDEGEPVLSMSDLLACNKAIEAAGVGISDEKCEELFDAVVTEKVQKKIAAAEKARLRKEASDESSIMPTKVIEAIAKATASKIMAAILQAILQNEQSRLKAIDADLTSESVTCTFAETKKVK